MIDDVTSVFATRRCKEPLKPRRSLEITSSHKATTSLPILAAYVTAADDRQISVVYGNLIKPAVETMVSFHAVQLSKV